MESEIDVVFAPESFNSVVDTTSAIRLILECSEKVEILCVGKWRDQIIPQLHKHRVRRLPSFPTSDDFQEAFSPLQLHEPNRSTKVEISGIIGRDLRVLLAEDNKINVKLMRKILGRFPCKVGVAENGREAVRMAKNGKWDVILMDLIMPEMDGIEATKQIRVDDGETFIVALTGEFRCSNVSRICLLSHFLLPFH